MLNELDASPGNSITPERSSGIPGPWHANLIRIERRTCLLLTNDRTPYSFLVPGVKKKDLGNFRELFALHLKMNPVKEGFGPEDISKALKEYGGIAITPTKSRSVLGSMNDLADQADFLVSRVRSTGGNSDRVVFRPTYYQWIMGRIGKDLMTDDKIPMPSDVVPLSIGRGQ